jgi:phosphoadenosine phosphosulfate reductase
LKRAIHGKKFWITGLRNEQSVSRINNKLFEFDEINNIIKINPLIHWSEREVWDYIKEKDIPYNVLHDKGFSSIGCMPCTRAVLPGEDSRSGRWWWENKGHKECGLHRIN